MNIVQVLLIITSVALSSTAQILFKAGMVSPEVKAALSGGDLPTIFKTVAGSLNILLGLVCFGLSLAMWLLVLSRVPLSTAYPFVALGIAATVFAGSTLFGELLSVQKMAGVAFIMIGITLVARS